MNRDEFQQKLKYFYPDLYDFFEYKSDESVRILSLEDVAKSVCWSEIERGMYINFDKLFTTIGYNPNKNYPITIMPLYLGKEEEEERYKLEDYYYGLYQYIADNKHKHMYWLL